MTDGLASKPGKAARPAKMQTTRWDLVAPALTAIATLALGAALNAWVAHDLERRKFEFEVIKYAIQAPDKREQIALLCRFSDVGMLRETDHQYHRAEIEGARPCATHDLIDGVAFSPADRFAYLSRGLGVRSKGYGSSFALEDGFLKLDGGLAPYLAFDGATAFVKPPGGVRVSVFRGSLNRYFYRNTLANSVQNTAHFVIFRDGKVVQLNNLNSRRPNSPVVVLITNAGTVTAGTVVQSGNRAFGGEWGYRVPERSLVQIASGVGEVPAQGISPAQEGALIATISVLCRSGYGAIAMDAPLADILAASQVKRGERKRSLVEICASSKLVARTAETRTDVVVAVPPVAPDRRVPAVKTAPGEEAD